MDTKIEDESVMDKIGNAAGLSPKEPAPIESLSALEFDLEADLDLLKSRLFKLTPQDRANVHNLIRAGIRITQNADSPRQSGFTDLLQVQEPLIADQGSGQNSSINRTVNPLDIHMIFNEILSYLPMPSLLNCRFVNRIWNSKAVPWIQEKDTLIKHKDFAQFCADFQNAEFLPVVKLSINLDDVTLTTMKHCSKFFPKHGADIRLLNIMETFNRGAKKHQSQENQRKLRLILGSVPNLKKLSLSLLGCLSEVLDQKSIFDEPGELTLPKVEFLGLSSLSPLNNESIKELFAMLPRLNTVRLGYFDFEQNWELLATALASQNIRTLHLEMTISAHSTDPWRALSQQGSLKLKELSMCLESCRNSVSHLTQLVAQKEFLESQAECLETLNLTIIRYRKQRNLPKLKLPVMKNLKNFRLISMDGTEKKRSDYSYPIIQIQPYEVPNMQTLCTLPELIDVFTFSVFPSVRKLNLGGQKYDDLAECAASMFPNLKKLSNCEANLCYGIGKTLKFLSGSQIEDLELNIRYSKYSEDFNSMSSGIPHHSRWALSQISTKVGNEAVVEWIEPPQPSFRGVKHLKKLALTFVKPEKEESVTPLCIDEFGVYMTFLHLSPAVELKLRGDFSITDALASKLTSHFQKVYINPTLVEFEPKPESAVKSNGPSRRRQPELNEPDYESYSDSDSDTY